MKIFVAVDMNANQRTCRSQFILKTVNLVPTNNLYK